MPASDKCDMQTLRIPNEVIKRHHDVDTHEIIFADGGSSLLSELDPEIKGNWRMKVRVVKKGEVRSWQNAKGEGQLLNIELMDRQGMKIQATLFKEMVVTYGD